MRKKIQELKILEALREGKTITAACKRAGLSRMTYDRLYKSNLEFREAVDEAILAGKSYTDDFVMTKYMQKIGDNHWPAIRYYLDYNVIPYREDKVLQVQLVEENRSLKEELRRLQPVPENVKEIMLHALKAQGLIKDPPKPTDQAPVRPPGPSQDPP